MEYPCIAVVVVFLLQVLLIPTKGDRGDFYVLPLDPDVLSEIDEYDEEFSLTESLVRFLEMMGILRHRIKRRVGRAFQKLGHLCKDPDRNGYCPVKRHWG